MTYTALAVTVAAATVGLDLAVLRTRLLTRRVYWVSYAIVLAFEVLLDGVLTCARVVRYNPADILGVRFACAPVEDLLFGFSLVTQSMVWWVWWGRRGVQREPPTGAARAGPPRW